MGNEGTLKDDLVSLKASLLFNDLREMCRFDLESGTRDLQIANWLGNKWVTGV